MSRLEELLEELVANSGRIADTLDAVAFSLENIRNDLQWHDEHTTAKMLLDAVERLDNSLGEINSSTQEISTDLSSIESTLDAIEINTGS